MTEQKSDKRRIFHPSYFSESGEVALAHAFKLALVARSEFQILNVQANNGEYDWDSFPGVREMLEKWGELPPDSSRSAITKLGVKVEKNIGRDNDPVVSVLYFLSRKPADLIVIATHQYQGRMRWLNKPIAEPIARESGEMTLFLPHGVEGFVSLDDGGISLREILIPVDNDPDPGQAIDTAASLAASLNLEEVRFTAIHVGSESDMPDLHTVDREGWIWNIQCTRGDPVENILQASKGCRADLIVMPTAGHDGFLDALRGSTTERVVRGANCPVLAIPVNQPGQ